MTNQKDRNTNQRNEKTLLVGVIAMSLCNLTLGAVVNLRCEYLENPQGIDVRTPRLSWITQSEQRGWQQGAYRILVASGEERLARDEGDLWDSGKVASDQSCHVAYAGEPLASRARCYWKVMVWDQDGEPTGWSAPAMWSMGLLAPEDWQGAAWIGWDDVPDAQAAPKPVASPKSPQIAIVKALYGVPGDAAKQVDLKEKIQQRVAAGQFRLKASNEFAGRDPVRGVPKKLVLEYRRDGKLLKLVVNENAEIDLASGKTKGQKKGKVYLPAPYLRKEFAVRSAVKRAVLYATAQGVFELHVNGKRVSDEYFMPGWTDYRKRIYYRTYDVTGMLDQGENAIGAILGDGWFRGNISILGQNKYGKRLRLKAVLRIEYVDGQSESVATGPGWKASFGPILESDMQAGETYDARREMPGWDRAGFDDGAWSPVDTGCDIKAPLLQAYPGVPVRRMQELPTVKLTEPVPGSHVFDLGQNFSGWIRLKVQGQAGDKVVMRFGEMLNADGTLYTANLRSARATDTYILKGGGEEVWEPRFTFHGFRYVGLTGVPGKPTADMVTGIVIHSDAPMASSFACSNPMLNQLYSNILWGQRSNYLEVPTDCPQRDERLGWTGDTQVFIRSGCYNQDVAAFFTKWNIDLMDARRRDGTFGQQAPIFHGYGSPGWADAGVICPWTIYHVYGDVRMVAQHYDKMARFIEHCKSKGLKGPGNIGFGDWLAIGSKTPKDLISAAYFAYSTSLMVEIADALDKKEDAEKYRQLLAAIKADFQASFVQADGEIAGNSQTAYCMAICFDLLTAQQREQAAVHLVERVKAKEYHLSVGFLGVNILLPALTEIGRSDLAYRLIQNTTYPSWGYSIEQGATTIWERWNSYTKKDGFGNAKMNSFNHYAYGACGEWMFRSMLGIDSDGAGFKRIALKPELGEGVTWAKGHHDCIYGRIESDWHLDGDQLRWKIAIPPNTGATLHVPTSDVASIMESGQPATNAPGLEFLRLEMGRAVFAATAGRFALTAKIPQEPTGDQR